MTVSFLMAHASFSQAASVVSTANANFTDDVLAQRIGIEIKPLKNKLKATLLDRSFLWHISHQMILVTMIFNHDHTEEVTFFVFSSDVQPVILGYPCVPLKGRLYSLLAPETGAMTEYIQSSLKAGLIRPSSSPARAGFFFFCKKDGSLHPCIDYRGLNNITVKNRYPLH